MARRYTRLAYLSDLSVPLVVFDDEKCRIRTNEIRAFLVTRKLFDKSLTK